MASGMTYQEWLTHGTAFMIGGMMVIWAFCWWDVYCKRRERRKDELDRIHRDQPPHPRTVRLDVLVGEDGAEKEGDEVAKGTAPEIPGRKDLADESGHFRVEGKDADLAGPGSLLP